MKPKTDEKELQIASNGSKPVVSKKACLIYALWTAFCFSALLDSFLLLLLYQQPGFEHVLWERVFVVAYVSSIIGFICWWSEAKNSRRLNDGQTKLL